MTDIGFGLIDRRTVIVVLFSMVIAQLLFGLIIPVDTTNVGNLFIDLVLLTGYLYLARSAYRFPVAVLISIPIVVDNAKDIIQGLLQERKESAQSDTSNAIVKGLKTSLTWVLLLILTPVLSLLGLLYLTFTFGEWIEDGYTAINSLPWGIFGFIASYKKIADFILGTLDRIGLIFIAVVATMPNLNHLVKGIGIGGLLIMVAVFTLRGDFTALVKDILEKKKEDKKESTPAIEINNSPSSPMYVKVINDKESPIEIKNSEFMPLYISVSRIDHSLPVRLEGIDKNPLPVYLPQGLYNFSDYPLYVAVTNVVRTEQDGE